MEKAKTQMTAKEECLLCCAFWRVMMEEASTLDTFIFWFEMAGVGSAAFLLWSFL